MIASLPATILVPLAGSVLAFPGPRRAAAPIALASGVLTLAFAADLVRDVLASGTRTHAIGGWGAPLGIVLVADGVAAALIAIVTVVGTAVTLYAASHLQRGQESFFPVWLAGWAGLHALVLSSDVFNLYVTLELTTLAAVGLVVLGGGADALRAALRYLLLAMTASLAYLLGVALLYAAHATLDVGLLAARIAPGPLAWTALALMTVGLLLKAAIFPLHAWLAPAHASAPAPASAVLSALVVKGAFVVLLRLWTQVFAPAGVADSSVALGALGAAAVLWGSALALRQSRLKLLIAYSTVAQLGYLLLLFPLGGPHAIAGAIYLALAHAAAKASLFLAAGSIVRAVGHDEIGRLDGLAHAMPVTFFAMGVAAVSLVGLPPSGGFLGKWLLLRVAVEREQWAWAVVLLGGGLLTAAYLARALRPAFARLPAPAHLGVAKVEEVATLGLALVALLLGLTPAVVLRLLGAP